MATVFLMRDIRNGRGWRRVKRELYKRAARLHDEAGEPLSVETKYVDGIPHKYLTLMGGWR